MALIIVCDYCKSQNIRRIDERLVQCEDCKSVFISELIVSEPKVLF